MIAAPAAVLASLNSPVSVTQCVVQAREHVYRMPRTVLVPIIELERMGCRARSRFEKP